MNQSEAAVLETIARSTQSELILFFIIAAVVYILTMVPMYIIMTKDRRLKNKYEAARLDSYMGREERIIEVVSSNTTIMAELRTALSKDAVTTNASLSRIHDRIDTLFDAETDVQKALVRLSDKLEEALRDNAIVKDSVHRILVTVNALDKQKGE